MARSLLGHTLVHGDAAGRIVEVEAYLGEHDPAAHAWHGRTKRTEVLYGPGGHAYVYLIYGMHYCLNVSAEARATPGCVLIRAVEPLRGVTGRTDGPGRLTKAFGITRECNGLDLLSGPLRIEHGTPPEQIGISPRIGIREAVEWPLRFYIEGNLWLSRSPLSVGDNQRESPC